MASTVAATSTLDVPTDVCEEYLAGFCMLGPECKKRHSDVDIEAENASVEAVVNREASQGPLPSTPQRKVCEDFAAGFCPNGDDCPDLHEEVISPIGSEVEDRGTEAKTGGVTNGDTRVPPNSSLKSTVHPETKRVSEDDMDIDELPIEVEEPSVPPPVPDSGLPREKEAQSSNAATTPKNSTGSSAPIASSVPSVAKVTPMPANGQTDVAESADPLSSPSNGNHLSTRMNFLALRSDHEKLRMIETPFPSICRPRMKLFQ